MFCMRPLFQLLSHKRNGQLYQYTLTCSDLGDSSWTVLPLTVLFVTEDAFHPCGAQASTDRLSLQYLKQGKSYNIRFLI